MTYCQPRDRFEKPGHLQPSSSGAIPESQRICFKAASGWRSRELGADAVVGRDFVAGLGKAAAYVSRQHFAVFRRGGTWWLRAHPGATNDIIINGTVLHGDCQLRDGLEIGIGNLAKRHVPVVLTVVTGRDVTRQTMAIVHSGSAHFQWTYDEASYSLNWPVDESAKRFFKTPEFHTLTDAKHYEHYVCNDPWIDQVRSLARTVIKQVERRRGQLSRSQEATALLRFVQSIEYIEDGRREWPRYPYETLVVGGGDCEDSSLLYLALLAACGIPGCLVLFKGHVATAVADLESTFNGRYWEKDGLRYFFAETTGQGWDIGERTTRGSALDVLPILGGSLPSAMPARVLGCEMDFSGASLRFQVALDIGGCRGTPCHVCVYPLDSAGAPLADTNGQYRDARGHVCSTASVTPRSDHDTFRRVTVTLPFDELHIGRGKTALAAGVSVFAAGRQIGSSSCVSSFWVRS